MIGLICVVVVACAFATIREFREVVQAIAGAIKGAGAFGVGGGMLVVAIGTFDAVHNLAAYAYVAPAAVTLVEYNDLQARALRDLEANRSDEVLKADFEALDRSAVKLRDGYRGAQTWSSFFRA